MSASRPSIAVRLLVPVVALVASAGVLVGGALWSASASATLSSALTSQTGTAADVYGSQSAIVVSSALLSAGIIGVIVSLAALGILIAFGALSKSDDELDLLVEDDEYEGADEAVPAGAAPAAASPFVPAGAGVAADKPIMATSAIESPDVPAVPTEAETPAGSVGGTPEASASEASASEASAPEASAPQASATEALAEPAPEPEGDRRA